MHNRLLSFLTDFEKALAADDPAPSDGSWENNRTVNYHLGLARLNLNVRLPNSAKAEPRGAVLLQSYRLADGSPCLKAALSWTGAERNLIRSIYSQPDLDWTREARKIAAEWMGGPPASSVVAEPSAADTQPLTPVEEPVHEPVAATG